MLGAMALRCAAMLLAASWLVACHGAATEVADPNVIRVAVVQTAGVDGSVEANADHAARLVRDAAARGARYVLLPELYTFFPAARTAAGRDAVQREALESGELFTRRMTALATELDVNVAFGMPELRDGRLYNALVFVEPGRVVGSYAKRWLLTIGEEGRREVDVFTAGPAAGALVWGGVRVGPMICSDGGAMPLWKRLLDDGAEIVIWASSGLDLAALPAERPAVEAFVGRVPFAFANRSRPHETYSRLYGGSRIVDASGAVLAQAADEADAVLVADVRLPRS